MKKLLLLLLINPVLADDILNRIIFEKSPDPVTTLNSFYELKKNQRESSGFTVDPYTGTYILRPVPRPTPIPLILW